MSNNSYNTITTNLDNISNSNTSTNKSDTTFSYKSENTKSTKSTNKTNSNNYTEIFINSNNNKSTNLSTYDLNTSDSNLTNYKKNISYSTDYMVNYLKCSEKIKEFESNPNPNPNGLSSSTDFSILNSISSFLTDNDKLKNMENNFKMEKYNFNILNVLLNQKNNFKVLIEGKKGSGKTKIINKIINKVGYDFTHIIIFSKSLDICKRINNNFHKFLWCNNYDIFSDLIKILDINKKNINNSDTIENFEVNKILIIVDFGFEFDKIKLLFSKNNSELSCIIVKKSNLISMSEQYDIYCKFIDDKKIYDINFYSNYYKKYITDNKLTNLLNKIKGCGFLINDSKNIGWYLCDKKNYPKFNNCDNVKQPDNKIYSIPKNIIISDNVYNTSFDITDIDTNNNKIDTNNNKIDTNNNKIDTNNNRIIDTKPKKIKIDISPGIQIKIKY